MNLLEPANTPHLQYPETNNTFCTTSVRIKRDWTLATLTRLQGPAAMSDQRWRRPFQTAWKAYHWQATKIPSDILACVFRTFFLARGFLWIAILVAPRQLWVAQNSNFLVGRWSAEVMLHCCFCKQFGWPDECPVCRELTQAVNCLFRQKYDQPHRLLKIHVFSAIKYLESLANIERQNSFVEEMDLVNKGNGKQPKLTKLLFCNSYNIRDFMQFLMKLAYFFWSWLLCSTLSLSQEGNVSIFFMPHQSHWRIIQTQCAFFSHSLSLDDIIPCYAVRLKKYKCTPLFFLELLFNSKKGSDRGRVWTQTSRKELGENFLHCPKNQKTSWSFGA